MSTYLCGVWFIVIIGTYKVYMKLIWGPEFQLHIYHWCDGQGFNQCNQMLE